MPRWSWGRRLLANAILALPVVLLVDAVARAARGNLWAAPMLGVIVAAYVAAVLGDVPERVFSSDVHETKVIPLRRLVRVRPCAEEPAVALTWRTGRRQTVALLWPAGGTSHGVQRLLEAFRVVRASSGERLGHFRGQPSTQKGK